MSEEVCRKLSVCDGNPKQSAKPLAVRGFDLTDAAPPDLLHEAPRTPERLPFPPKETEKRPKSARNRNNENNATKESKQSPQVIRVVIKPSPEDRERIGNREASH